MSNCDFVAGRSLIDLVASRLALRAPALSAASALTRPNQSARWLSGDRHGVPTVKVVGPNDVITNHGIEHGDHLAHDRNDHDLRHLAGVLEALTERLEHRIPIARAHRLLTFAMEIEVQIAATGPQALRTALLMLAKLDVLQGATG
jgi:hypothetical protein